MIRAWFERTLSDPQTLLLLVLLGAGVALIIFLGGTLFPLIAALVIAYVLQGGVNRLERRGVPHILSVSVVFVLFLAGAFFVLFALMPLLVRQVTELAQQIPAMIQEAQAHLMRLPQAYPELITTNQVQRVIQSLRAEILSTTQWFVSFSLASVVAVATMFVYFILVPVLVFFLLKDRRRILDWLAGFLPHERDLARTVWTEVNSQFARYIRGKFWEIIIVAVVTYTTFTLLGLNYAALLGAVTGLSVLIPYIGAATVTFPVAIVAYFQWGVSWDFGYVVAAYGVLQALDGNLLAPLLLGNAVNIHPVAVIAAILFFGAIWGFWGVFFAIPLAVVIQAVLRAWPRYRPVTPAEAADASSDAA